MDLMNFALFIIALLMSVTAVSFVAVPLVRSQRVRSRGSANVVLLGVVVVFGLGIALYAAIGQPNVASHEPAMKPAMNAQPANSSSRTVQQDKVGSVASLLTGLEARLQENPDDGKGWLLLAQSYELLGRLDEAGEAYERAKALGVTNEDLAARLAHGPVASNSGVEIRGRVSIDPTVAGTVSPDAVVYVIAKSGDNPMPLAVLRRSASELPFDFVLSEKDTMVQGAGLANAEDLSVSVRISATGDALGDDGGLQATVRDVDPRAGEALNIVIRAADAQ